MNDTKETVSSRKLIGLRNNHDYEPPRLEACYEEVYAVWTADGKFDHAGPRIVWEEIPDHYTK
jgi:hypothetical protein